MFELEQAIGYSESTGEKLCFQLELETEMMIELKLKSELSSSVQWRYDPEGYAVRESQSGYNDHERKRGISHDEAFKRLLQTFFAEFLELFFPQVNELLDHSQTRFLMQELLVDIVGQERRSLDLLLETRYKSMDAYVLIHMEPQSYRDPEFRDRMFIYFSRLFELYRKQHKLIIPVAIFTTNNHASNSDALTMEIPGQTILHFNFLKLELANQKWRNFIDSDNPVAAALLANMGYNKDEEREVRKAYLRMILRLHKKLDKASLMLVMSFADQYFTVDPEADRSIMEEIKEQNPEEGATIMEFMPAWMREGYVKGLEDGQEKGREEGRRETVFKLVSAGMTQAEIARILEIPLQDIQKLTAQ